MPADLYQAATQAIFGEGAAGARVVLVGSNQVLSRT